MFPKHWFLLAAALSLTLVAIGVTLGFTVLTPSSPSLLVWLVFAIVAAGMAIGLVAMVARIVGDIRRLFGRV